MRKSLWLLALASVSCWPAALLLQTDYGERDGAVAAMKGVIYSVADRLPVIDLTHHIPPYDQWQAGYRLYQTYRYWPKGTVFISIVAPDLGADHKAVVARSKSGHYFVVPDNGTMTVIADNDGIDAVRVIDEGNSYLVGAERSPALKCCDVYAYTGARLAAGQIKFEEVGPELKGEIFKLPYRRAGRERGLLQGNIPVLDVQYGNVWTNINADLLQRAGIRLGDWVCVDIREGEQMKYSGIMPYQKSFGDVAEGASLLYLNNLMNASFALNRGNFADKYKVESGNDWNVTIKSCPAPEQ